MKIHPLDLHFQEQEQIIASYLIEGAHECFLIETGPASTLPNLHAALKVHGLRPADIHHLFVTHIHLDHAGAAGWWAQQGTQVYVHHFGAPHLVDPTRLLKSATRIYGDRMLPLWGEVLPAPADKVTALHDGDVIEIDGLQITALDTPGHAWHHHAYRMADEDGRGNGGDIAFSGDAAGVRLRGSNWICVPAVPPEFSLETWLTTIDRLQQEQLAAIYLTHYGRLEDVAGHLTRLRAELPLVADVVRRGMQAGLSRDEILDRFNVWSRNHARAAGESDAQYDQYETATPAYISVDGLIRYWSKRLETENQ